MAENAALDREVPSSRPGFPGGSGVRENEVPTTLDKECENSVGVGCSQLRPRLENSKILGSFRNDFRFYS